MTVVICDIQGYAEFFCIVRYRHLDLGIDFAVYKHLEPGGFCKLKRRSFNLNCKCVWTQGSTLLDADENLGLCVCID
ncbi:MAG: hypothetical protein ACFFC0_00705 [Promethearchaeota archaeon]